MREIKFRGWYKTRQCMWDGGFSVSQDGLEIYNDNLEDISYHLILMQYTGLKDKNGKEIYEGDIVRGKAGSVGQVKWIGSGLTIVGYMGYDDTHHWGFDETTEVIGNIYENPELLVS